MSNWSIQYLYPTQVYCAEVENFDSIQDEIQSVIEKSTFDYFSGFGETHKLSQHFGPSDSSYLMGDLPIFNKELQTHIERYGKELKYYNNEYQVVNSWMTLFEKGDYAHIHDHKDVSLLAVENDEVMNILLKCGCTNICDRMESQNDDVESSRCWIIWSWKQTSQQKDCPCNERHILFIGYQ